MSKPVWFLLIEQWKVKGMGATGITLPFLVGALARIQGMRPSTKTIRDVLQEIVANPFQGYVTEVRWCANVDAPVISVSKRNVGTMPFMSHFASPRGEISLGFSQDVQSMFGLNCGGSSDCLEKLVAHAAGPVELATYSRVRNVETGKWEFADFLPKEVRYIREVAAIAASAES
ncbi:hypothetical protein B1C78_08950 [Thioalkalivibrio denitrificans]|uniref:Uncharacterized protein n=1 Tax=Thioalkalivibrio denitrificans TaxID=108003 RepID=A0A1V3NHC1_9GAMM|nr:hypothetical protein [Thioalkalivibrio denitrificans]OOG24333.1 hypothetical protein B1C78_08950 [Thioalkalivibrio denitrificans]